MVIDLEHIKNTEAFDLTASQMRIWSGQMLEPDKPLYNMTFAFEIKGHLNPDLFAKAFQRLVNAQEVFRLVISADGDIPKQYFLPQVESPLEFYDVSDQVAPDDHIASWIDKQKLKLFNTGELLYHTALFKLNDQRYVWYLNQHHLITDGWSMIALYQSLSTFYEELNKGLSSEEPSTSNYQNFAAKNSFFQQIETSDYWEEKKSHLSSPPALYGNRSKNNLSNSRRITVKLGKKRTANLKELCTDSDIRAWSVDMAMNNVLLTLISALTYKTTGQSEFTIGMPAHNRPTLTSKKAAGLFMELLPLHIDIEPTDSFLDIYRKGRDEYFQVIKNSVEHKPPVEFLRSFNVLLNYIPQNFPDFAGMKTTAEWIHPNHHDPGHHLRLQIHDFNKDDELLLLFDLNKEVFTDQKAEAVIDHFLQLTDTFIQNKNVSLQALELISDKEIRLINTWNDTDEAIPEEETLLTEFEKQSQKTPNSIALVFDDEQMTYRQFNEKANQVGHFLQSQGIKEGDVVGVQLERSFELMWCLYGILKTGAIYLPIDVSNPTERTQFLIEDANIKLLFTSNLSVNLQCNTVSKNDLSDLIAGMPIENPLRKVQARDTAYIIYTSGSTGKPKGVVCHHLGICNKLRWRRRFYPLTESDSVLQKTSITFDISLWELFWPLQVGSRLVLAPPQAHKDSAELVALIRRYSITNLHLVPSMLNVFLAEIEVSNCTSLRRTFCVGEALHKNTVDRFHQKLDCKLYNMYGPTEAALEVTHWECEKQECADTIPIGTTTPNTQLHVLDNQLKRVPVGTPGELYIAGAQVAHGYLNDDALTESRFIKNPFRPDSSYKMYKTGDLARYLENGALEYLGRTDYQVKLRGFRVELGEIEVAMMKHTDIDQAVVTKVEQGGAKAYLVGYYTGSLVEENQLKSLIGQYLPAYMIPSFFVHMEAFPLSASGKVDRKKLPEHHIGNNEQSSNYQAPETRLQEMIAETWEEILQVKEPGIYDKFTDLGGDSLKALVITSRLKDMLDLDLSVHLIFKHNDISAYANYLEKLMVELMSQEDN